MSDSTTNVIATNTTLVFNGQSEISAMPDIAVVTLGVQTIGNHLSSIEEENARSSTTMLNALQKLNLDIRNKDYSINKVYDYDNGIRLDKGYIIRNIYEITLDNLANIGSVIDVAVSNDGNIVDQVSFQLTNPEQIYQQALNEAVIDAFTKAKSVYTLLGRERDPNALRITENSSAPSNSTININPKEGTNITPVEPGKSNFFASVTIEFI